MTENISDACRVCLKGERREEKTDASRSTLTRTIRGLNGLKHRNQAGKNAVQMYSLILATRIPLLHLWYKKQAKFVEINVSDII